MKLIDKDDIQTIAEETIINNSMNTAKAIPAEYIPITLTTGGRFGVPKVIYIKNFSIEDILSLSVSKEIFQLRNSIKVLQNLIWNPDNTICINNWLEEQVSELLLRLYANYYGVKKEDLIFPINEDDIEWLKNNNKELYERYINNEFIPRFSLDLQQLEIKPIPNTFPDYIELQENNKTYIFKIPRVGDVITLETLYKKKFFKDDMRFETLSRRIKSGNYENLTFEDYTFLEEFPINKAIYLTTITKLFMVEKIMSDNEITDLNTMNIEEKLEYLSNLSISPNLFEKYNTIINKKDYGIIPVLEIINPITGKLCTRRFSFRVTDLVTFILLSINTESMEVSN
ncbi:MAG TPA: hypothetical protein PLI42_00605 [Candidatus Pacearchaeota archaeon]|nr:hypothetical protein [Candidatus Pacearchaeota archaeon]